MQNLNYILITDQKIIRMMDCTNNLTIIGSCVCISGFTSHTILEEVQVAMAFGTCSLHSHLLELRRYSRLGNWASRLHVLMVCTCPTSPALTCCLMLLKDGSNLLWNRSSPLHLLC